MTDLSTGPAEAPRLPLPVALLDAFVRRAVEICLGVSCCMVMVMTLYGSADVLATFLLGRPVPLARELSEVLLAVTIFAAMATALREDRNVSVDLVVGRAGPGLRRLSRGLALLVGGAVFALLAWRAYILAAESFVDHELAAAVIRFPIWPAKALVALAIAVTLAEYVRQLLWLLLSGRIVAQQSNPQPGP